MPSIHIKHSHSLGKAVAKTKVEEIATQLQSRLGVAYHWEGDQLVFTRSGAHGTIQVTDNSVTIDIDLGIMLGAFKGEVEKQLKGYLDKELGKG